MQTARPLPGESPHPLRLWSPEPGPKDSLPSPLITPDRSTPPPSLDWTVARFYREYVLPKIRRQPLPNRRPSSELTVQQDLVALNHWKRLTGDATLYEATDELLAAFVTALQKQPGPRGKPLSQNGARKVALHLGYVLEQAAKPTRRHPKALGLFAADPQRWPLGGPLMPTPPAAERDFSNWFSPIELDRIFAELRRGPDLTNFCGVPGSTWWPSLGAILYNVGLRIDTAMRAERSMVGRDVPPDFIKIPAAIWKRGQQPPPLCLNRWARAAIEAVAGPGQERLLPWQSRSRTGELRPWPSGRGWLFTAFRRILAKAGIRRHVKFNGFRSALETWAICENPGLAPVIAGHKARIVTVDHYTHFSAVRDLMAQVPQPGQATQRELF